MQNIIWKVLKGRPISDEIGNPLVETDKALYKIIKRDHQETVELINKLG
ncbi:hypothetical protein [Neobacillus massiliamazoniensis]|nr:hypothetical protein [Neobacillus massiliamazoniensis]